MALVLAQDAKPSTFEELIDGFETRCCYIDGKYYISVRDLIIAVSRENPKEDKETWEKACTYASNTWQTIKKTTKLTEELGDSLKTFQFEGDFITKTSSIFSVGLVLLVKTVPLFPWNLFVRYSTTKTSLIFVGLVLLVKPVL